MTVGDTDQISVAFLTAKRRAKGSARVGSGDEEEQVQVPNAMPVKPTSHELQPPIPSPYSAQIGFGYGYGAVHSFDVRYLR